MIRHCSPPNFFISSITLIVLRLGRGLYHVTQSRRTEEARLAMSEITIMKSWEENSRCQCSRRSSLWQRGSSPKHLSATGLAIIIRSPKLLRKRRYNIRSPKLFQKRRSVQKSVNELKQEEMNGKVANIIIPPHDLIFTILSYKAKFAIISE